MSVAVQTDRVELFWARVARSDGCWEWQGARSHGYGVIRIAGCAYRTHRLAWEFTYGPIPDGLRVLHRCDNPPCVRPDHLFLGTQKDNMRDAAAKGRCFLPGLRCPETIRRGAEHPCARLTEEAVREIRVLYASGATLAVLGRRFKVDPSSIAKVVSGRTWRHVV